MNTFFTQSFILFIFIALVSCLSFPARPVYPPNFVSNWTYTLAGPRDVISQGWTTWAGYDEMLYYYMSALDGWEQILSGTRIYNFYRAYENCCYDDYGWELYPNYFNNATWMGYHPSGISGNNTAEWVGSLYTDMIFGFNVTYFIRTEYVTGYPTMYLSANVVNYNASEIMYLKEIEYIQPPLSWFDIPEFCYTSEPCEH